jgi:hypothetical protein
MLEVSVTPEHTRDAFVDELTEKFAVVQDRLIFVSLIYPSVRLSYQVNIHADLFHFFQRVLRKVPKRSWRDPQLKRLFVIEENDEAGLHCHFIFEIPTGMTRDELIEVCREQWVKIALRDRKRSEHWKRLNCGARISLAEKRTILIKKNQPIVRPSYQKTRESNTSTKRPLAVIKPVDNLRGAIEYCLKLEFAESPFESGEVLLDQTDASFIKGHFPALSCW